VSRNIKVNFLPIHFFFQDKIEGLLLLLSYSFL